MKRFKNILLLYEGDHSTLDRAAMLAKNNRARLTVVQVVREMPEKWRRMDLGAKPVDLQALAIEECQSRLKELVTPLKQDGVRVTSKVLCGATYLEIIREVMANNRDLVMMTAEGKGGLKQRLLGSTSRRLLRQCPCPIWIMKPSRRKRFLRILAAIDPDPDAEDKLRDSLNATILQLASSLAAQESSELHIAHAWTLHGEQLLRSRGLASESEIRKFGREEAERHRRKLDALLAMHAEGSAQIHVVKGLPSAVIPHVAATQKVDLLVMGTVCRTGISGFFIGNTAESILDVVDCSVLAVKPQGFHSAVQLA